MIRKVSLLLVLLVIFGAGNVWALGNGELQTDVLSIIYNVNMLDEIRAIVLEVEYGLTYTLSVDGRYIYSSGNDGLDMGLKFKLYENPDLKIAGRVGLSTDFNKFTPIHKTLGFVFTKGYNSFVNFNGGADYSMNDGKLGFFGGIDYQLASRAYLQAGYQKFVGQTHNSGFVIGLRTDL